MIRKTRKRPRHYSTSGHEEGVNQNAFIARFSVGCTEKTNLGNVWLRLHDDLGNLYKDEEFAALFSSRGRLAEAHGLPPAAVGLRLPHDSQAQYSDKGGTMWELDPHKRLLPTFMLFRG